MRTLMIKSCAASLLYLFPSVFCAQSVALPYYTGWDNTAEMAGWQEYRTGFLSSHGWYGGPGSIGHDYNVGGAMTQTVVDWYVSPPLDFATTATISLKWQGGGFSQPTVDNLEVYFSSKKADPAAGTYSLIGNLSYVPEQYKWRDTSFFVPYLSDSGYIAFKYRTVGAMWMTYSIDSLHVKPTPSTVGLSKPSRLFTAQVFPNPSSDVATITFSYPVKQGVLTVSNALGKPVITQDIKGATATFHKGNLPQGVYFYVVHAANFPRISGRLIFVD